VSAQIFDRYFKPVVGGNLLRLAPLHSLKVGHYYVGKNLGKSGKRIVHVEILRNCCGMCIITGGRALVIEWRNLKLKRNCDSVC